MKKLLFKYKYKILICLLIVSIVVAIPFTVKRTVAEENLNCYQMEITFDNQNMTLSGKETVTYFNNSDNAFSSLYFHLYPNAFREGANVKVVSSNNFDKAYPNGISFGSIDIKNVYNDNQVFKFKIAGEDQNILQVDLLEDLYPDENVEIKIDFDVKLPNVNHRFGFGENTINLGNFYPIACVYEDGKGFFTKTYHSNGDPFYSDVANYEVEFKCNKDLIVATSGIITNKLEEENEMVYSIKGEKIRDFCMVLSNNFEKVSAKVDNVTVNYFGYLSDADLNENLNFSIDCLKTYNSLFGDYPYKELNVVKSNFVHGGMEWPNLVMISDDITKSEDFKYVIAHEIAHQWWYGVIGNNQYDHAWLDEGLTEYSTYLFYQNNPKYGLNYEEMVKNACDNYKFFVKIYNQINGNVDTSMDRALNEFDTEPEYVHLTYTKGVLLFDSLRQSLGDNKFFKTLKNYFEDFAYKNVSPEEFIAEFNKYSKVNLEEFINSWLNGEVVIT